MEREHWLSLFLEGHVVLGDSPLPETKATHTGVNLQDVPMLSVFFPVAELGRHSLIPCAPCLSPAELSNHPWIAQDLHGQ